MTKRKTFSKEEIMAAVQVIKYEGDNTTFIWKHPCEDFESLTQLIVHESQEVIFFMNGQALDLFGPGKYTLETQSIPKLTKFFNRTTGDKSPFHSEVYFINKTEQMAIKWGTDSQIQYLDPTYNFPLSIGASGEMSLRVEDSRKLLVKLVGTENILTQQKLTFFFRSLLMIKLKSYVAQTIKKHNINIFELDEHLNEFSKALQGQLIPDFLEYGIALERFFITNIAKPDGERQYEQFKSLHFRQYADIAEARLRQQTDIINAETEAQRVIIDSKAQATKRAQEGYTYQQERGFDVASDVARNSATGQFSSIGLGLGTMMGIGGTVGSMVGSTIRGAAKNISIDDKVKCPKCGASIPAGSKFCSECGQKIEIVKDNSIICPWCGKNVQAGKFCPECGHKIVSVCRNCGAQVPVASKFCPECGTSVEEV